MTRSFRYSGSPVRALARLSASLLLATIAFVAFFHSANAQILSRVDIPGPAGSGEFGKNVTILPNGNFVIVDSSYDAPGAGDVGAVYLYDGGTLALISQLTGSTAGDQVGSGGVTVLTNSNFVVRSPFWINGAAANAGAATWVHGTLGLNGEVSASNSLVGSTTDDYVSQDGVTALSNGNYVVASSLWDNGLALSVGAVTWGNGTTGTFGAVSTSNSLIGGTTADQVGSHGITALPNGNYVVSSRFWRNGGLANAGAATWVNGGGPFVAQVSASNSLVGASIIDSVGSDGITVLPSGNYVVRSSFWDNGGVGDAGAFTWVDSETGLPNGPISSANSMVGDTLNDQIGATSLVVLSNGNFVVTSLGWSDGASALGAVTWGSGTTATTGVVSSANSLVGVTAADQVGNGGVFALSNGNYVVSSPVFDPGGAISDAGAATLGNGETGTFGEVATSNSLVGSSPNDQVGSGGIVALTNGNFVVISPNWDDSLSTDDVGAVTWVNGDSGLAASVSSSNSLVGSTLNDQVGSNGVIPLPGGNYVIHSPAWDNQAPFATGAGAVTWGNGAGGTVGAVSGANSLVGDTHDDQLGTLQSVVLSNGNYVTRSPNWRNGASLPYGAATWANGDSGVSGTINSSNSLIGQASGDNVGQTVAALTNGNYVVGSPLWQSGGLMASGAATWGNGASGTFGEVSAANSLVGTLTQDNVAFAAAVALPNGSYVVPSPLWTGAGVGQRGAVTLGDGSSALVGAISESNSLIGATAQDALGLLVDTGPIPPTFTVLVTALPNSEYVIVTPFFDGLAVDSGAISLGHRNGTTMGIASTDNSAFGAIAAGGTGIAWGYNSVRQWVGASGLANNTLTIIFYTEELNVDLAGSGVGAVTSNLNLIVCGNVCTADVRTGEVVTLTAVPDVSSDFLGWSGPCSGTGTCTVTMTQTQNVGATFAIKSLNLAVSTEGSGSGTITGAPANPIEYGTVITLTAAPSPNSDFAGWGGACTGASSETCILTMTQPYSVSAVFNLKTYTLTVNIAGSGSGSVSGAPANPITHGSVVTLTATANANSNFTGWTGACAGTAPCVLTMTQPRTVTATFTLKNVDPDEFEVTISNSGDRGTVTVEVITETLRANVQSPMRTASPAALYPEGTILRLTATPFRGYSFVGWSGDATGAQNPLEVTVTGPLAIAVLFDVADNYLPLVGGKE